MAGVVGQFLANPTDLVKVQMQMEGKGNLKENHCGRSSTNRHFPSPFDLCIFGPQHSVKAFIVTPSLEVILTKRRSTGAGLSLPGML